MKIILSPTKSLNKSPKKLENKINSELIFKDKTKILVNIMKKYSAKDLSRMMKISQNLSELNYIRYQNFNPKLYNIDNSNTAIYTFSGDSFRGLNSSDFDNKDLEFAQNCLYILSGLYGIIRPLDLIQDYRLEMGKSFIINNKHTNLYSFWNPLLTDYVNINLQKDEFIINLASNEYSKVLNMKSLKNVINISFKEIRNSNYISIMTYAKYARGLMTRYIIKNKITDIESLKGFNDDNYIFSDELSTETEYVFVR